MEALNPLDWTAGPFLLLYAVLAAGVLLLLRVGRHRLGDPAPGLSVEELDALHLAYLSGGADRAAGAALVGLMEAGAAMPDRKRGLIRFDPSVLVPVPLQPFRHVSGGEADRAGFQREFLARWQRLHDDLLWRGLVPGPVEVGRFRAWGVVLLGAPLLLGAAKVVVGLSRDRPVGILCALLVVTSVLGILLLAGQPCRNLAGAAALATARERHARAARAPLPAEMALAFALSGPAVLAGRDYRWALTSGSSSSSSDGGSSDGGGDGGGGGCGGCSG